jgi:hypothetical protein
MLTLYLFINDYFIVIAIHWSAMFGVLELFYMKFVILLILCIYKKYNLFIIAG